MKKALTIIELLIAVSLFALILTIISTISYNSIVNYKKQQLDIKISIDNKSTLDDIITTTRQSRGIANNIIINGKNFVTSQNTIILLLPGIDSNGKFIPGITDYAIFYQDPVESNLLIKLVSATPPSVRGSFSQIKTTNLSSINFGYDNPDPQQAKIVTITIETSGSESGQTRSVVDTTKVKLRNL
ncbi:MAG: hypothetical protein QW303_06400 [Nitrososphaerota archaeon]